LGQNLGKFGGTGRVEISEMQYANFGVFVVFLIEIVMKKCYISTLKVILGLKNPVIAYRQTGLGPGQVGSRLCGLGRVASKKIGPHPSLVLTVAFKRNNPL